MKFEFAKYTEVTDLALRVNGYYKESGYTRVFICPDVNDAQLIRVLPGVGDDYECDPSSIIVEHNMIPNKCKGQGMTISRAEKILSEDDFSSWDYHVFQNDIDEVIATIDNGFGILNLKESEPV